MSVEKQTHSRIYSPGEGSASFAVLNPKVSQVLRTFSQNLTNFRPSKIAVPKTIDDAEDLLRAYASHRHDNKALVYLNGGFLLILADLIVVNSLRVYVI